MTATKRYYLHGSKGENHLLGNVIPTILFSDVSSIDTLNPFVSPEQVSLSPILPFSAVKSASASSQSYDKWAIVPNDQRSMILAYSAEEDEYFWAYRSSEDSNYENRVRVDTLAECQRKIELLLGQQREKRELNFYGKAKYNSNFFYLYTRVYDNESEFADALKPGAFPQFDPQSEDDTRSTLIMRGDVVVHAWLSDEDYDQIHTARNEWF